MSNSPTRRNVPRASVGTIRSNSILRSIPQPGRTRIPVKLIVTQLLAQVLASSGKTLYGCQRLIARLLAPYPSLCSGKCYSTPRCESMETNSSANGPTRSRALAVDERASPNVAEATACRPSLQCEVVLRALNRLLALLEPSPEVSELGRLQRLLQFREDLLLLLVNMIPDALDQDVDLRLKAILFRSHLVELLEEGFHQVVLLHGLED